MRVNLQQQQQQQQPHPVPPFPTGNLILDEYKGGSLKQVLLHQAQILQESTPQLQILSTIASDLQNEKNFLNKLVAESGVAHFILDKKIVTGLNLDLI